jgi:hypothetical protein
MFVLSCGYYHRQVTEKTLKKLPVLYEMSVDLHTREIEVENITPSCLAALLDAVEYDIIPEYTEELQQCFQMYLHETACYGYAMCREVSIRSGCINLQKEDPYYGLIKVTEEIWNALSTLKGKRVRWTTVQKIFEDSSMYFTIENAMMAGRHLILRLLMYSPIINYCIHSCTPELANAKVKQLASFHSKRDSYVSRDHELTMYHRGHGTLKISHTLYTSPSDILHRISSLDCDGIGYDKNGLWMTQRRWYALTHGINTRSFECEVGLSIPGMDTRFLDEETKSITKVEIVPKIEEIRLGDAIANTFRKLLELKRLEMFESLYPQVLKYYTDTVQLKTLSDTLEYAISSCQEFMSHIFNL